MEERVSVMEMDNSIRSINNSFASTYMKKFLILSCRTEREIASITS